MWPIWTTLFVKFWSHIEYLPASFIFCTIQSIFNLRYYFCYHFFNQIHFLSSMGHILISHLCEIHQWPILGKRYRAPISNHRFIRSCINLFSYQTLYTLLAVNTNVLCYFFLFRNIPNFFFFHFLIFLQISFRIFVEIPNKLAWPTRIGVEGLRH